MPQQNRKHTAYHEAGHSLAAYLRDSQDLGASIVPNPAERTLGSARGEEGLKGTREPDGSISPDMTSVEELVVEFYAGYAAEVTLDPKCRIVAKRGAASDFERAEKYLRWLPGDAELNRRRLHARAQELVAQHWAAVDILAKELLAQGTLDGDEVSLILGVAIDSADPEEVPRSLASYRSMRGFGSSNDNLAE